MKKLLWCIILSCEVLIAKAQDSLPTLHSTKILKISIGSPSMYLLYPRYGMKHVGLGYELARNHKTSYNFYLDYFYIKDGSYNHTALSSPDWQLSNFGNRHILSFRTLYKWYPLHRLKFVKGIYVAGGFNASMRYIFKKATAIDYWGDFHSIDFYAGLGWGIGYKIEVKKKISLEFYFHHANNGLSLLKTETLSDYEPIPIDLLDVSIGYVF